MKFMRTLIVMACAAIAVTSTGCVGGTANEGGDESLSIEQIESVRSRIHEIRRGSSRDEMWEQLTPMLGTSSLPLVDDSGPARHASLSYRMGHGYILRLMFDPNNPDEFRRAEIVKR